MVMPNLLMLLKYLLIYSFKFNLLIAYNIVDAEFYILIGRHGNANLTQLTYLTYIFTPDNLAY